MSIDIDWYLRSQDVIAQAALTNSKRAECFVKGVYPTHLKRGAGCYVWDTKGNRYYDFICGLGSNILGYGNLQIAEAMYHRAVQGCTLSLATDYEVIFGEKLKEVFPFIHKIKILKTGSEACSAAVRIARTKTGRNSVLSSGYHGWSDPFVSLTPPSLGIPAQIGIWPFKGLDQITKETAAVIVEPIMTDFSPERVKFLQELRAKCTEMGAILIFDEVITGFRTPTFSVSRMIGVTPDLICLGKAMGNGMPISVVGGSTDIMECDEYFVSSTFAGETLSIVAAQKTIEQLQTPSFDLHHLWNKGEYFVKEFNKLGPVKITGYPTRGVFEADLYTKALFWQEACMAGILFGPSWFFNFPHIEHIDKILSVCKDIMTRINTNSVKLIGALPQPPFSQRARNV